MITETVFTAVGCSCRANVLDYCPFIDYIVYAASYDIVLVGKNQVSFIVAVRKLIYKSIG